MKVFSHSSSWKAHLTTSTEHTALRRCIADIDSNVGCTPALPVTVQGRQEGGASDGNTRQVAEVSSDKTGSRVVMAAEDGRKTSLVRKLTIKFTSSVVTAWDATFLQRDCTTSFSNMRKSEQRRN